MANARELELLRRREEILRETVGLTSNIVQSLEQQQKLAHETKENLHTQNLLLSLANDKMRSMNEDLTSVVNEMNEIDTQPVCLCCNRKKKKKKKKKSPSTKPMMIPLSSAEKAVRIVNDTSSIPKLIENNDQEKVIANELNQMRSQLIDFQDQVKTINKSFVEGDEMIHQLSNESDQYMHAITTALNKAEQVLGRKFVVSQTQPAITRERKEPPSIPQN